MSPLTIRSTLTGLFLLASLAESPNANASGWEVETRPVGTVTPFSGNTPAFWGYHQPIIVRVGTRVYAALLQPWGEGHNQQFGLYELSDSGWSRIFMSPRTKLLNQPPSRLGDEKNRLHVFAWLDGVCHHFRVDPSGLFEEVADVGYDDLWPYAGAAANADGELLVVPSSWPSHRYGYLAQDVEAWQQGTVVEFDLHPTSPSNYNRHAYPFVAFDGRSAHIFSTQDVEDAEKVAAGDSFTYSFRTLEYYYSDDLLSTPFEAVTIVDVEASRGWAHNDDLHVDQNGIVHILYRYQETENESPTSPLMHAFGPPGGPLTHVAVSSETWSDEGRLWEAPNGVLFVVRVVNDEISVERLGSDGRRTGEAASLGIFPSTQDFTSFRVFLAPARASAGGAPFLEGLYQIQDGDQITVHYFLAKLPELVADVDGNGSVDFGDFLLFAESFGTVAGANDYNRAADATADGVVDFNDFLEFAQGFQAASE